MNWLLICSFYFLNLVWVFYNCVSFFAAQFLFLLKLKDKRSEQRTMQTKGKNAY